jgi:hypothetical protein
MNCVVNNMWKGLRIGSGAYANYVDAANTDYLHVFIFFFNIPRMFCNFPFKIMSAVYIIFILIYPNLGILHI